MKLLPGWRDKMIKVTVSREARRDLVNIHQYILEELEILKQQTGLFMSFDPLLKI